MIWLLACAVCIDKLLHGVKCAKLVTSTSQKSHMNTEVDEMVHVCDASEFQFAVASHAHIEDPVVLNHIAPENFTKIYQNSLSRVENISGVAVSSSVP